MKTVYPIIHQIVKLIPQSLVQNLAETYKIKSRGFTPFAHITALLFFQLGHLNSLNSVCDVANAHRERWTYLTGTSIPHRNTFSHANNTRDPRMAESLFWEMLKRLEAITPDFKHIRGKGFLHRFKRPIYAIDSSTIQLVLNCMDWAKHRRQKAAAKLHMTLDLCSLLPHFAIVESASHHDSTRAANLTESLKEGDIVVADRAYLDFSFLEELNQRKTFFVIREKTNFRMKVVKQLAKPQMINPKCETVQILSDEEVVTQKGTYTSTLRRIKAYVQVDKQMRIMTFLTNNFEWQARTIAELYKARWNIELFFKEFKQTCQLQDFLGYSENAIKWQVWTALLAHLLLRYIAHLSTWKLSFSRLVAIIRNTLWQFVKIMKLLESYGTARLQKNIPKPPPPLYYQDVLPFGLN